MARPTNHHVIITTPNGKVRGNIINVKRMGTGVASITVEMIDVLPFGHMKQLTTRQARKSLVGEWYL